MFAQRAGGVHSDSLLACIGHCGRIDLRMRGDSRQFPVDTVSFTLQAGSRNAGETGRGFMTAHGDRTLINLTITGVPPWVGRPIQLFTYVYAGSCAKRDATPAYALNDTVQVTAQNSVGVSGPFTIAKVVPVPMAALRSGGYAIVLRTSPADGNWDIFCGDMKSAG